MTPIQQMLLGLGGGGPTKYIEECFDCQVYRGNATARSFYPSYGNGVAFFEGGQALMWQQKRDSGGYGSCILNTTAGSGYRWDSHTNNGRVTDANALISNPTSGSYWQMGNSNEVNKSSSDYVSWMFSKKEGFFDMLSYTGNGGGARTISHSLNATVGAVLWLRSNNSGVWWHRGTGSGIGMDMSSTDGSGTNWISSASTTSVTVHSDLNQSGVTYYMHLFAHDDQTFGKGADESVIYCGTIDESTYGSNAKYTIGWQPRWILVKVYDSPDSSGSNQVGKGNWVVMDTERGLGAMQNNDFCLEWNTNDQETKSNNFITPVHDGFYTEGISYNANKRAIFIAIRDRGMKHPEDKDSGNRRHAAFGENYTGNGSSDREYFIGGNSTLGVSNMRTEMTWIHKRVSGSYAWQRLYLRKSGTYYENVIGNNSGCAGWRSTTPNAKLDKDSGQIWLSSDSDVNSNGNGYNMVNFQNQGGVLQFLNYKGSGSNQTITHGLGAVPKFILWIYADNNNDYGRYYHADFGNDKVWESYATGNNSSYYSGSGIDYMNSTTPTKTEFTVKTGTDANTNGRWHMAMVVAEKSGYSYVGSHTADGTDKSFDIGFVPSLVFIQSIGGYDGMGDSYGKGDSYYWCPGASTTELYPFARANSYIAGNPQAGYISLGGAMSMSGTTLTFSSSTGSVQAVNHNGNTYAWFALGKT